ncbi:precorrin-2 C20-methyltransferase [Caldimicrobium thiodismutans]|uniref:Precorrin-2 C20-methyltransferase n=1 Tax=Caldimicrobium thiodismutans TaxID=1653476 RepID=A0A0U5AVC5_9BACT|nr:precorrin-2 C(20)-methyltransferase [Caldimicrobium thiodismutans]BAU22478.1 precorrin-2 C20-methyltransferase [Caldimicrobium thiodismutans]
MKLYVIGVGPGDPELITLKGLKILKDCPLLFYPTGGRETLALSVIEKVVSLKDKRLIELYFPMQKIDELYNHWEELAQRVSSALSESKIGAFITLGDPAFYSTFFYLKPFLEKSGIEMEIIPGISSFSGFSAKLKIPLSLNKEEVVITNADTFLKSLSNYLIFDTIVLLKTHRYLKEIKEFSKKHAYMGLVGKRVGQDLEKIWYNLDEVEENELDYFTLVVLKKL